MRNKLYILFLFCFFLPLCAAAKKKPVAVILTAGQSNADGRVPLAELPEEMKTGKRRYRKLPVVCGTYARGSRMRSQQVVDALYQLQKEDKNFHVVDAEDLPLLKDKLHFNAEGAIKLGERVFEVIKTIE